MSIALLVSSCSSSTGNQVQEAQIDSAARVKAAAQDVVNQKRNDSTINAIALAKADSIEKAIKTQSPVTTTVPGKDTLSTASKAKHK
jgi:hypothetical protein